jgi:hypothetical protein
MKGAKKMADVRIAGNTVVLTSVMTLEQIKRVEKHRAEALITRNEKNEPIFRVGTGSNALNTNGASFNADTLDDRKLAFITLDIPSGVTNAKEWFAETYAQAFTQLESIEAGLTGVLNEVARDISNIMGRIGMADAAPAAAEAPGTEADYND